MSDHDPELEAAIDKVGRDRVFARARIYGWGDATPPKWVWWCIVHEFNAGKPPPAGMPSPRLFPTILPGFFE